MIYFRNGNKKFEKPLNEIQIYYYQQAFDAKVTKKAFSDDDPSKLMYGEITIGGNKFFVCDAFSDVIFFIIINYFLFSNK